MSATPPDDIQQRQRAAADASARLPLFRIYACYAVAAATRLCHAVFVDAAIRYDTRMLPAARPYDTPALILRHFLR